MDFSTLNVAKLKKLDQYKLPPSYQLQDGSGNGCAGDPPGYPTYFTRNVYTKFGNDPPHGRPSMVITFERVHYVVGNGDYDAQSALLHRLWSPLPIDHPRTRL